MKSAPVSDRSIQPHTTREYTYKQGIFPELPKVPLRGALVGPSGQGKTVALVDMVIRLYRGCFARIYVFSPSVRCDSAWQPVRDYIKNDLHVDPEEEPCMFDHWDEEHVGSLIKQQMEIAEHSKNELRMKRLHSVLFICDDFADSPRVVHTNKGGPDGGSWLISAFIRGRHSGISSLVSSQYSRLLGPVIRTQTTFWMIWKLRSAKELFEGLLYELTALYPLKTLVAIYEEATREKYSFLFVNLQPKSGDIRDMFWKRFESRLVPRAVTKTNATASMDQATGGGNPKAPDAGKSAGLQDVQAPAALPDPAGAR